MTQNTVPMTQFSHSKAIKDDYYTTMEYQNVLKLVIDTYTSAA